jgi:magnesium chelatase family protein
MAAFIGGGSGVPTPGEAVLAHRGVLFLDELGEFPPQLLDALRTPIEDGSVIVARQGATVEFPCQVQVVGATNPCPCGFEGDRLKSCECTASMKARYKRRFSGPLLDRFDLQVEVPRLRVVELSGPPGEDSASVRARVTAARRRQFDQRGRLNRELRRRDLDALVWTDGAVHQLTQAASGDRLTARAWDRVRRVARTVADLAGSGSVDGSHVDMALSMRVTL